jgi:hypothetical protein
MYLSKKIVGNFTAMVSVNKSERVETAAFRVAGAVCRVLGQVVLHQGERVLYVPAVDHTQACGCRKLGPKGNDDKCGLTKLSLQIEERIG